MARRDRRLPDRDTTPTAADRGGVSVRDVSPAQPGTGTVYRAAPGLGQRVRALFGGGQATEETWRELEEALVRADVGPRSAKTIVERVRQSYRPPQDPAQVLSREIAAAFDGDKPWSAPSGSPGVVMVVGVNGTGKTTTIGKLAWHLRQELGKTVLLGAADTFRAAAVEQLTEWARRADVEIVTGPENSDPGSVARNRS